MNTHRLRLLAGFGVHAFTALGSVCALFAVVAVSRDAFEWAFGWLFVALVIDAVDGTLARAVDVERVLPRFSGERLDLVVDYVTYVFVPVLALLQGRLLDGAAGVVVAGLILLSSLYHFADTESKSGDNCFIGFPAVWNIVAFCLFAWGMRGWWTIMLCTGLVALTFVPMRWLHPMRVQRLLVLNIAVTAAGLIAGLWVLWRGFPGGSIAGSVLALSALYYVVLALCWPRTAGG
jgi:phosphatidylcholine synthase